MIFVYAEMETDVEGVDGGADCCCCLSYDTACYYCLKTKVTNVTGHHVFQFVELEKKKD